MASWIGVPIAVLFLVPGLALMAFGLGAGRGLAVPTLVVRGIGVAAGFAAFGGVLGAAVGLIGGLFRRDRPGSRAATWWDRAYRPIRLRPASRDGRAGVGRVGPGLGRALGRLWPWLLGVPTLLVVVVAFGFGVRTGREVDRRLDEAISAADRDDPDWRLDDLLAAREPVPDDENSAILVEEALWLLPEGWPSHRLPEVPGWVDPPPTELVAAFDRLTELEPNVRLDDETAATLRAELEEHEEAVGRLRAVADYERGRHELRIGPAVIDTRLPETQEARTAARLLSVDAAIGAHDGDPDGSIDSCRAILGVARSIGDEPMLISHLVRIAIGGVAMQATRRVLGQGNPSGSALERLQAEFLDERLRPLLLIGIRGERASMLEMIRRLADSEIPIDSLGEGGTFRPGDPVAEVPPWSRLCFENQMALALELMNEAVAIAQLSPHGRRPRWEAWEARIEEERRDWHAAFTKTIPILMTPAVRASDTAHLRHQAELGAMVILLAAERHRLRHGDWPDAIEEIDADLLPGRPIDPFSGEEYRIHRPEGRFVVASIGPNGRDDGGDYEPRRWMDGGPDDVGGSAWDPLLRRRDPPAADPIVDD